jgi:microcystin-dependent protein
MGQPYVGEIRMFGGNFAPAGWMFCEGQLLPISEFETLFNLIGTTYGGDGQSTFGLPDLRGRLPIHQGNGFTLAETGGVETVTLTVPQIPSHNHSLLWTNAGPVLSPSGALPAVANAPNVPGLQTYAPFDTNALTQLNPASIQNDGGSQPHDNFQPYLCVSFIISLFGIFPSQT